MPILDGLLNSYKKLRKREYSFSEALLIEQEQFTPQQKKLFKDSVGWLSTEDRANLASLIPSARLEPLGGNPTPKGEPFLHTNGDLGIGGGGTIPASEIQAFVQWLTKKDEPTDKNAGGDETAPPLEPVLPATDGMITSLSEKANNLSEKLGIEDDSGRMDIALERLQKSLDGKEAQSTFGKIAKRLNLGDNLDFSDEALVEIADDFSDLLDLLTDHVDSGDDCINVSPGSKEEKLLDRFFYREKQDTLMYGSASQQNFPLVKSGVDAQVADESSKLRAKSAEARYGGVKIAQRELPTSLGGGENPIFSILDKAKDISRCGGDAANPKAAFKSSAAGGAVSKGFTTARSYVNEHVPHIASVMAHLRDNPQDTDTRNKLGPIVDGILSRVEKELAGFQGMCNVAFGDNNPMDILSDEKVAELNDFLESIGLERDGSNIKNVARAFVAQLIIDELKTKEFEKTQAGKGFKGHVTAHNGKNLAAFQGIKPAGAMWYPTISAERTTADYGISFETGEQAVEFALSMGSTASPRRLQQIKETGVVGVSDKFYGAEKDLENSTLQLGMLNVDSTFTPEANELFNIHVTVLRENGVPESQIGDIKKERKRQREVNKRLDDSFDTLEHNPADESADEYLQRTNHMEGLIGELNILKKSCPADQLEHVEGLIKELEEHKKNPLPENEAGHLKAKTYNVMSMITETPKSKKARFAHDAYMAGGSTNEVLFKARVFGGETYESSQSQLLDDTLLSVLNGSIEVNSGPKGIEAVDPVTKKSIMRCVLRWKDGRLLYDATMSGRTLVNASKAHTEGTTEAIHDSNHYRQEQITKGLRKALQDVLSDILKEENIVF